MCHILIFQSAFNAYRLFFGDPMAPAETWSIADIDGERSFASPAAIPLGWTAKRVRAGVYCVEPTIR